MPPSDKNLRSGDAQPEKVGCCFLCPGYRQADPATRTCIECKSPLVWTSNLDPERAYSRHEWVALLIGEVDENAGKRELALAAIKAERRSEAAQPHLCAPPPVEAAQGDHFTCPVCRAEMQIGEGKWLITRPGDSMPLFPGGGPFDQAYVHHVTRLTAQVRQLEAEREAAQPLPWKAVAKKYRKESLDNFGLFQQYRRMYRTETGELPRTADAQATPWPPRDVVAKLVGAVDHLYRDHDCDLLGYEGVMAARDAARVWLGGESPKTWGADGGGSDLSTSPAVDPLADRAPPSAAFHFVGGGWR